jgi:hypothetical protein
MSGAVWHYLEVPATPYMKWFGEGATIKFDSSINHPNTNAAVLVDANCSNITVQDLSFLGFTGTGADDFIINSGCCFYMLSNELDFNFERNTFQHVCPLFFISDDNSSRCLFSDNRVFNSPLGIPVASYSKILDNWFHCDAVVPTRSHAVYLYGHFEHLIITGNSFKNIADEDIQIRGSDAYRLQKRTFLIANNYFEGSGQYSIWAASDERVDGGSFVISDNIFRNCSGPLQLVGMRDAIVDGNMIEYDYLYAAAPGQCIAVTTENPNAISSGVRISNNTIVNRQPFFAQLTITVEPADGDTVTIGSVVYTWRTTPAAPGDVQRNANVDVCATNLSELIGGHGTGPGALPINVVCRDTQDSFHSQFSSEGVVVIASENTFAVSVSGAAVTISTVRRASLFVGRLGNYYDSLWDATYEAINTGTAGNSIQLSAVGDAVTSAGSLDDTADNIVFHYQPFASTVGDMNTLANTSTQIRAKLPGTTTNVIDDLAAFGSANGDDVRFLIGGSGACRDATSNATPAIEMSLCRECTIASNKMTACGGIAINFTIFSRLVDNDFHQMGEPNTPSGIGSRGNMFPYFANNRITPAGYNVPNANMGVACAEILNCYDAFPVIRDMDLIGRTVLYGGTQANLLPELMGGFGVIPVGDGKVFGYLYYGSEQFTDQSDASSRLFRWIDGDRVSIGDGVTTYTFTFARVITSPTDEFNSYATLTDLINTQTGGTWAATNPSVTYFGSDPLGYGYIRIAATAAGGHADAFITVSGASGVRSSETCGVTLRDYPNLVAYAPMAGSSATPTKTVFFTRIASITQPLIVQGVDAASQALNPIAYLADVVPGVCYVITHDAAAGTERFYVKVGS